MSPDGYFEDAVQKQTFDGRYTATSVIVTLSIALAYYNSLEMVLLISATFKRWQGLYFWSLTLCNQGVFFYTLGMMLGIMLAGAREMKNTSLKNLKDVRAYTNLPVLSSIPLLENALT